MPLEFRQDDLVLRVDDDVLEIRRRGAFSERIPLCWLAVQIQPSIKGKLLLRMLSARTDMPFYEVFAKAQPIHGSAADIIIRTEEEPVYRQFFLQVAQACGRL